MLHYPVSAPGTPICSSPSMGSCAILRRRNTSRPQPHRTRHPAPAGSGRRDHASRRRADICTPRRGRECLLPDRKSGSGQSPDPFSWALNVRLAPPLPEGEGRNHKRVGGRVPAEGKQHRRFWGDLDHLGGHSGCVWGMGRAAPSHGARWVQEQGQSPTVGEEAQEKGGAPGRHGTGTTQGKSVTAQRVIGPPLGGGSRRWCRGRRGRCRCGRPTGCTWRR